MKRRAAADTLSATRGIKNAYIVHKFHWRFFLLRWHRRLGITSALFVLLLVITGILLNHGHEFGLDRAPLENRWLRQHYGLAAEPAGLTYPLPGGELAVRSGRLHLGGKELGGCAQLVGVIEQAGQVLAACSDRLLLLTLDGELIDQADAMRGVPDGLSAVLAQDEKILLRRGESRFSVDLSDLSVTPLGGAEEAGWPSPPPAASAAGDDLDWERVVLDLHSGRLFGRGGVWLMDAMAGLFAVLAISGLVMARRRRHRWP